MINHYAKCMKKLYLFTTIIELVDESGDSVHYKNKEAKEHKKRIF